MDCPTKIIERLIEPAGMKVRSATFVIGVPRSKKPDRFAEFSDGFVETLGGIKGEAAVLVNSCKILLNSQFQEWPTNFHRLALREHQAAVVLGGSEGRLNAGHRI